MVQVAILTSSAVSTIQHLVEETERAGIPLWVIPIIIVIVLLLIFLSSYFSSSGIQHGQAVAEDTADSHDEHDAHPPAEPAALQVEVSPTALTDAPETAVTVAEKLETSVVLPEEKETAVTVTEMLSASEPTQPDDLKIVEGIGPKIEGILHESGITTFAQLATAEISHLEKIVKEDAGIRIAFPDTWPEQAKLAAEGLWDALEKYQDELKGGRQV